MPPKDYWESLVDAEGMLDRLGFTPGAHSRVLELGCGYGTFTVPTASRVKVPGLVRTYDFDEGMVQQTVERAAQAGVSDRVQAERRDVVANGYGVEPGSFDAAILFNILHAEGPVAMLRQAALALEQGGLLYAAHWNHDASTPRGPPLDMRPKPEQIEQWALATGLLETVRGPVDCPPWHYGWVFKRL